MTADRRRRVGSLSPEGSPPEGGLSATPETSAPDDPAPSKEEERVEQDVAELLADVERERDEYLELAKRTKADFENYRRRLAKEAAEAESRGRAQLARELISVADNLERALKNIAASTQADSPVSGGGSSELADGVRLVYRELTGALANAGVESYEPAGEQFDPDWHEAMLTQPVEAERDGQIIEVLEKGYRLDGQVLRPARVVVGKEKVS